MAVQINVVGKFNDRDIRKAQDELDRLGQKTRDQEPKVRGLQDTFKGMALAVGAVIGSQMIGKVIQFGVRMDAMATESEQISRRLDTTFGDMADYVREWADDNNEKFGESEEKVMDFAGSVQDVLIPLGFARDTAGQMSLEILEVANALSEWTPGTTTEQAVGALTAALTGEREQLKQFGVVLKDADIKARLAEEGLSELTGEALKQAEAQIALEEITRLSGDAIEAYGERAGSAIAETKELTANVKDAERALAEVLAPEVQYVKGQLAEFAVEASAAAQVLADWRGSSSGQVTLTEELDKLGAFNLNPIQQISDIVQNLALRMNGEDIDSGGGSVSRELDSVYDSAGNLNEGARELVEGLGELPGPMDDTREAAEDLGDESDELKEHINKLKDDAIEAGEKLQEEFGKKLDELAEDVGGLPSVFDEAGDDIDRELSDMLADWRENVDRQSRFTEGLERLYRDGFDDFADMVKEEGPAAVATIEEFYAMPIGERLKLESEFEAAEANQLARVREMAAAIYGDPTAQQYYRNAAWLWAAQLEAQFNNYPWEIEVPTVDMATGNPVVTTVPVAIPTGNSVGAFHDGGVVPGPVGMERLAVVQAGETIIPYDKSPAMRAGSYTFNFNGPVMDRRQAETWVLEALEAARRN